MDINDKYIVALASASIFDRAPAPPPAGLDWDYIFKTADAQNITGLLYCAVNKIDAKHQPDRALMSIWNKRMLSTMGTMARRYNEFLRMSQLAAEKGMSMIGLKGCMIRELYPVPELRTMGDFDVLVRKDQMDEVVQLFQSEGYHIENDVFGVICIKQPVLWEVFYTLEEEFLNEPEEMDKIFFQRCVETGSVKCPEPTYFLAHLFVHMGKHYVSAGAGIRNFCDIALFINRYKSMIDFGVVKQICEKENFGSIYNYLISAAGEWFGVDTSGIEPEKCNTERFIEYALSYGVFGKHDNELAIQVSKFEDDSIGAINKIFFPSVKMLKHRYKYLKKCPFLLPAAWVHRGFKAVFVKKRSVKRMAGELKDAVYFFDERKKWLKELGLLE